MFGKNRKNKTSSFLILILFSFFVKVINSKYVLMCYYGIYYRERSKLLQQNPEIIQPFLCTHIIYNYAKLYSLEISAGSAEDDQYKGYAESGLYARLNDLKTYNKELKTLLSVGGTTARSEFTNAIASDENMQKFAMNAVKYLRKWKFDGLTLDWEYPNQEDKKQFTLWCKKIMEVFTGEAKKTGKPRLLLTLAVQKGDLAEKFYQMDKLAEHVDIIHLITFDYIRRWPPTTMPDTSVKLSSKSPLKSLENSIDLWLGKNVPKNKLVAGLSTYARTFTLNEKNKFAMGDDLASHGKAGPLSKEVGYLFYDEVCTLLKNKEWTQKWDDKSQTPYAYFDGEWISYDNIRSFKAKVDMIKKKGIAGASIFEITQDDFKGTCGKGLYPLTGKIHLEFFGTPYNQNSVTSFVFSTTAAKTDSKQHKEMTGQTKTDSLQIKEVTGQTKTTAYIFSGSTITLSSFATANVSVFQLVSLLRKYLY